ncbi:hypothetical protein M011DRAFT_491695 [Sporormia fimetaria CBS 119925]|uniref:F-box domain-containing protein n=1 Tax=Sporormia fimetaria CBS 119925 TaxID=1340428 RepID=A0A6A6VKD9_9PLEO|nr:hypothetical protein M011DRAFT_491695 [Sporormia fimetaria CBS 119925]
MAYAKVLCHICGVSFKIGRIRTAQEPRNAAWAPWALPTTYPNSFVEHNGEFNQSCPPETACMYEHIASLGCKDDNGYSGHEISVKEMRFCQTAQCLVWKPRNGTFEPLPDDEEFEKDGDFFLSGLTDHMPSRDYGNPEMTPPRHGCDAADAEYVMWDENAIYEYAMPFHPACLEVYKRATLRPHGKVNVNSLSSFWSLEAHYNLFYHFPRDPNLRHCMEQWWCHRNGTEYLVANLLFMSKLDDILEAALDRSSDFSPHQRAFRVLGPGTGGGAYDPFGLLPVELQYEIFDYLPSRDIASLRLTSRVFSKLPVTYFQKLLLREMPWLREAWPTAADPGQPIPYSKWTTMTAHEAKLTWDEEGLELAKLSDYVEIVRKEMPELAQPLKGPSSDGVGR